MAVSSALSRGWEWAFWPLGESNGVSLYRLIDTNSGHIRHRRPPPITRPPDEPDHPASLSAREQPPPGYRVTDSQGVACQGRRRGFVLGRIDGYGIGFSRPFTQIDETATLAAERPEPLRRGPCHWLAAGGALYDQCHGGYLDQNRQQVSRNSTSSGVCMGRSTGSRTMKRMVKRCLPPLISAKYGTPRGTATRSNW